MSEYPNRLSRPAVLLAVVLAAACQQAPSPTSEPSASVNPLMGVWSLVAVDPGDGSPAIDPSQPGLYIFADDHYSAVFNPGAQPRMKAAMSFQPTQEEMASQFGSIIVNAGTYEISGSTVTFSPMIAKSPAFVGGHQTSMFDVNADTLRLSQSEVMSADGMSPPEGAGTLTLVRVE